MMEEERRITEDRLRRNGREEERMGKEERILGREGR